MSTANTCFEHVPFVRPNPSWDALTLAPVRLACARALVVFSFVWPFFNFDSVIPGNSMEIDFLLVFLAVGIVPEVSLREKWSILLALPAFAVALLWANPTAPLRLMIGIVPFHFILNLTRHLRERGRELIPPNLAYRSLQVFAAFCMVQTIQFRLFPLIPEWLSDFLTLIVPRYATVPYDFEGIRGVQGWASEPSSAGLMCIAFALVAILQRPDRRWRVLALFVLLLMMNKSIYFLILTLMLALACALTLRRKIHALLVFAFLSLGAVFYMAHSNRLAIFTANLTIDGLDRESNHDLMRFMQILNPLEQFPHIYRPLVINGVWVAEPMGLLPLVAGYGGVLGLAWLVYVLWRNFPRRLVPLPQLALIAAFVLLIMASPDLIPSIVALAAFFVPRVKKTVPAPGHVSQERSSHAPGLDRHPGL